MNQDDDKNKELTKKEKIFHKIVYGIDSFISVVLFLVFIFAIGRIVYVNL